MSKKIHVKLNLTNNQLFDSYKLKKKNYSIFLS